MQSAEDNDADNDVQINDCGCDAPRRIQQMVATRHALWPRDYMRRQRRLSARHCLAEGSLQDQPSLSDL